MPKNLHLVAQHKCSQSQISTLSPGAGAGQGAPLKHGNLREFIQAVDCIVMMINNNSNHLLAIQLHQ